MEYWVVFYDKNNRELCSYTIRGTFSGEVLSTIKMLAYENGLNENDISFRIEAR